MKVLQYFQIGKKKKPFTGSVVSYLPPTKRTANDDYWHVVWEDGDECDYDLNELQNARQLWLHHRN